MTRAAPTHQLPSAPRHTKRKQRRTGRTARQRHYSARWEKESQEYLRRHPWCARHAKIGEREPARVVDHIKAHKGDLALFWNKSNWQSLCLSCHAVKTNRYDAKPWG